MRVTPPDLELWLTEFVRTRAAAAQIAVTVANTEPADLGLPLGKPLVVIRDDSGNRLDWTTFDRSVGVSVLAGTTRNGKPASDLGRWLAGLLFDDAIALVEGSPIAAVEWDGCNGPYAVQESLNVARRYLTAEYTVVGD
ncbi:hypothetical protein [Herbiconiux sp.]|uniref:hypothetical protein n=1 Tax=Herbiconiux sp. TaxID=1871186 RepID=UPI0025C65DCA|nr:hypothetical protein [Herbiconiux sp.]